MWKMLLYWRGCSSTLCELFRNFTGVDTLRGLLSACHRHRAPTVERGQLRVLVHLVLQLATMRLVKNQIAMGKKQARVGENAVVLLQRRG